jgi:sporulation protein YlmC with PRC-barrel domain
MDQVAGWVAPILISIAALMTASNRGARFTGWGFVVFTFGSIAWLGYGVLTGQGNLIWQNAILLAINLFGVWRWLGRSARYEDGAAKAERCSVRSGAQPLIAISDVQGLPAVDRNGQAVGSVIDAMIDREARDLAYYVISQGGIEGAGETLHAVPADAVQLEAGQARLATTAERLKQAAGIEVDEWPAQAPADWDRPAMA